MNKQSFSTGVTPTRANMQFLTQHLPFKTAKRLCVMRTFDLEDGRTWSVRNMTDEDVRRSIVGDLLIMITLGIEYITSDDLIRLINDEEQRARILGQLKHKEVQEKLIKTGDRFKLRMTRRNMQDCMDYAGIWHEGFEPYANKAA